MKKICLSLFLPILLTIGCVTGPGPQPQADLVDKAEPVYPQAGLNCFAVMNTVPGTPVNSVGAGRLKQSFDALSEDFSAPVVFDVEHEYYYKGETLNCRFELIYEGIGGTPAEPEVSQNDIIGNALGERVSLCARSKELDPYLISCSYHPPQEKDGYWYYFPGMYISTEMKFLSFQPADYGAFKSMYDHATTGEEALGMTLFNWWSLVETRLDEYPVQGEQTILFEDIPLHLEYQKGFPEYLLDEYVLGDPIYLYLQIRGISGFSKEYNCYVRDFSLEPPEEIIRKRLAAAGK